MCVCVCAAGVHEVMLKDSVRNTAYRRALEEEFAAEVRGKVVLDVGCGTGLLSLMAARAGGERSVADSRLYARALACVCVCVCVD